MARECERTLLLAVFDVREATKSIDGAEIIGDRTVSIYLIPLYKNSRQKLRRRAGGERTRPRKTPIRRIGTPAASEPHRGVSNPPTSPSLVQSSFSMAVFETPEELVGPARVTHVPDTVSKCVSRNDAMFPPGASVPHASSGDVYVLGRYVAPSFAR